MSYWWNICRGFLPNFQQLSAVEIVCWTIIVQSTESKNIDYTVLHTINIYMVKTVF